MVWVFLARQLNHNYLELPALDSGTTAAPKIRKLQGKGIDEINNFNLNVFFYFLIGLYMGSLVSAS